MTFVDPQWSPNIDADSPFLLRNGQLGCVWHTVKHNDWRDWCLKVDEVAYPDPGRAYIASMKHETFRVHAGIGHGDTPEEAIRDAVHNARLPDSTREYLTVDGRPPNEPEIPDAQIYIKDWIPEFTEPARRMGAGLLP